MTFWNIPAWPILIQYLSIGALLIYVYVRNHNANGKRLAMVLLLPITYLIYAYWKADFSDADIFEIRNTVRAGQLAFNFVLFIVLYRLLVQRKSL